MSKRTYTDISGNVVKVNRLDWLENGIYLDYSSDHDQWSPCSHYDTDNGSVWLNGDMQEVSWLSVEVKP